MEQYDVIAIGAGGGTKIVSPAARLGLKVAVIEKDKLGGTCLNRGCIPSKMLIHPADVAQEVREARKFDIHNNPQFTVDFAKLVSRISDTVDRDSESIVAGYTQNPNIEYIKGAARFTANKTIAVNGRQLTAEKIFIAVGTRPDVPDVPGLKAVPFWTSTEALRNTVLPKKLIVLGASYIAVELGHAYGALGSEVHFIVRSRFLRREDKDISEEFTRVFREKYHCHIGYAPEKVSHDGREFSVTAKNEAGETVKLTSDALLVATGIVSNADTLGLDKTGIRVDDKNFIIVDDCLQTGVEGVYAFGDCIGRYFFRHSVNFEGEYLFRTLFIDKSREPIAYPPVPHAIFSSPQTASVGYTEQECGKIGLDVAVGINPYKKSAMGMALLADHGFCKVIVDRKSRRLVGAHIIGPEASDMIHTLIAFMNMNATLDDVLNMIFIHPALPEIVRNAARNAKMEIDGDLIVRPRNRQVREQPRAATESGKLTW